VLVRFYDGNSQELHTLSRRAYPEKLALQYFHFTHETIRAIAECSTQTLQLLDTKEFWLPGEDSNLQHFG
jgi:hypothetical protein